MFTPEEGLTDLGVLNGPYSSATEVGPAGEVVGWSGTPGYITEAFLVQHDRLTLLGPVPGGIASKPACIAADRTVVGSGWGEAPPGEIPKVVGFLWRDGVFTLIAPVPGYDTSGAGDINSAHQVTGSSFRLNDFDHPHAYVWQHGVTRDLNDLVPPGTPTIDLIGAINDQGQILAAAGIHCLLLMPVGRPLGDLDIDCKVGITDFLTLLAEWGEPGSPADLNGDGTVDPTDLTILIKSWG